VCPKPDTPGPHDGYPDMSRNTPSPPYDDGHAFGPDPTTYPATSPRVFASQPKSWWVASLFGLALAATLAGLASGETTIFVAGLALIVASAGLWLVASAGLLLIKSAGLWLLACVRRASTKINKRQNKRVISPASPGLPGR
jgi:hypothetical protein